MQQTSLLLLLLSVTSSARRLPSCPNDQQPKLNKSARPIQCLPGSSSRAVCGTNHTCFFSGINYMCCPSNEPSSDNQLSCPSPSLTILDYHGMPIKCNPRTRSCPKETSTCTNVGTEHICCERLKETVRVNNNKIPVIKRAPQKKDFRTTNTYDKTLSCPQNTIGLFKSDGTRVLCSTAADCPGRDTFCYGTLKNSICCERYNFVGNTLDLSDSVDSPNAVDSSAKLRKEFKIMPRPVHEGVEGIARVEPNLSDSHTNATNSVFSSTSVIQLQSTEKIAGMIFAEGNNSSSFAAPSTNITTAVDSDKSSTYAPPVTRPVAFASLTVGNKKAEHKLIDLPSVVLPSQLLSKQDKRSMAQQFLVHQIRNGWPYADRFYRSDLEAFSTEQRKDMARIHFSDN